MKTIDKSEEVKKNSKEDQTETQKETSPGNRKETQKETSPGDRKEAQKEEQKETRKEDTERGNTEAQKETRKEARDKKKSAGSPSGDSSEAGQEALIRFENVGKIYRTGQIVYEALHNVNLTIMEGELVVILGPSGAGKSTLLNLLGGLDGATSGKIYFGGEDITSFDDNRLGKFRAVDVGIVFQFYNLVPTLTAIENVDLMQDLGVKIMDPLKALEMVGLADRKDNFPSQMSGGQQQRISIARAIAKMPRLLLCDEPTGALDTNTGKEVLQILQDQSRVHHKTVVMVTHNALFADIADKVVMVKNGTVVEVIENENPLSAEDLNW